MHTVLMGLRMPNTLDEMAARFDGWICSLSLLELAAIAGLAFAVYALVTWTAYVNGCKGK